MKPNYQKSADRMLTPVWGGVSIAPFPHLCRAAARRSPGS